VLQPIDFGIVALFHAGQPTAFVRRQPATVAPAHPSLSAMQPRFEELQPTCFSTRELARALALPNPLLLSLFTLMD